MKKITIALTTLLAAASAFASNVDKHQLGSQTQSLIFNIEDAKADQHPNVNRLCLYHLEHAEESLENFKDFINLTNTQAKFANKIISTMFEAFDEDYSEEEVNNELVDDAQKHIYYARKDNSCENPRKIAEISQRIADLKANL